MNTRSIHFRLILWYSSLATLVLIGFGAYIYQGVQMWLFDEVTQTLSRRGHQIADNVLSRSPSAADLGRQIRNVYSPEANNRFIRIVKGSGEVLYVSGAPKDGSFDPKFIAMKPQKTGHRYFLPGDSDTTMLMVDIPAKANGQFYTIEMGAPTDDAKSALHGLMLALVFGLPIVVVIVSAGGYLLVRRSMKPVEDIRATAEQITFGNLSNRLPLVHTGDELEHLSTTLNQMLDRLDHAYQQASRFSADASHELRTPLTIMRSELETMLRDRALSPALHERIGSVLEETERLSRVTGTLFAISRLEAGEAQIQRQKFDLAALTHSTAEQMILLAEEKHIQLGIQADAPVPVYGDSARMKQIVVNLLDNAIKYTPDRGSILLNVKSAHHKALLEVIDTGVGIPGEALPHVFDRLYRADKARSREPDGAGLGLSIVRSIVQAHGGNVEIESREGEGTICRVELPLAEEQELRA